MKQIRLWILLLLSVLGFKALAQNEPKAYWEEANRAYEAQQYQHAIDNYEKILSHPMADDALYYNLGNAYYRNKQTGKAVLNYKRALRVNANNKMASENIAFIQRKTPGAPMPLPEIFFMKAYHAVLNILSANAWAILSIVLFIATLAIVYRIRVRKLRYGYRWLSLGTVTTLLVMSFAYSAYHNTQLRLEGVVLNNNAFLYEQDNPAKVKGSIPEGSVVRLMGTQKDSKILVSLANGSEGWIDKGDIEIV